MRLLGIDAPETPGHCRRGRVCAPGDPYAARDNLASLLHRVRVEPVTTDRYGRPVAVVRSRGVNLSCAQLRGGYAIYKPQWDNGGRIRRECPEAAR